MPSSPRPSALQPTTWRPAGPLRIGSRRLRQPTTSSISGTSQPTLPTRAGDRDADRAHDRAGELEPDGGGADDRQREDESPTPSRRCSGSRSRAVGRSRGRPRRCRGRCRARPRPDRARAPRRNAGPARDRSGRARVRRAARGLAGALLRRTPSTRGRGRHGRLEDELLLREPGGEDVRVAMVRNLGQRHSSHTDHTPHDDPACQGPPQRRSRSPRRYAAWPTCWLTSFTTLTRRTPRVTGGSQWVSTTRSRSSGCRGVT